MSTLSQSFGRTLGRLTILVLSGALFVSGVLAALYMSVRSPEVTVPKVVGTDRATAEAELEKVRLNMRVRQTRYDPDAKPDTVLDQSPRAGEIVKEGQTIALVTSRNQAREGEEAIFKAIAEMKAQEAAEAAKSTNEDDTQARDAANTNRSESVLAKTINANAKQRATNRNANSNNSNANNANTDNGNKNVGISNANNGNATANANRNAATTTTNATNTNAVNRNAVAPTAPASNNSNGSRNAPAARNANANANNSRTLNINRSSSSNANRNRSNN